MTVVCDDVPGAFARVAGVLSLRGLDVLHRAGRTPPSCGGPAMAAPRSSGAEPAGRRSTERPSPTTCGGRWRASWRSRPGWPSGPSTYRRRRPVQAAPAGPPSVIFHDDASSTATVIEVRAPNRIGVLHRITRALADLGLDIRHATVQTIGEDVVDTFYVLGRSGRLVTDGFHRAEIGRAVSASPCRERGAGRVRSRR